MAMSDYGAIVFKNGKCLTKDMFTPMEEAVGWVDDETMITPYGNPLHLNGMYFTYVGDEHETLAFYKCQMARVSKIESDREVYYFKDTVFFCNLFTWSKWRAIVGTEYCTVRHRNGYFVCRWKYKGDRYKVYFGEGVDISSYERWKIVNYYRSPMFLWDKYSTIVKEKFKKLFFKNT